ncbi:MAG: TetR/AcrR family transcriptional regulator [Myxococcota bacterium]
MSTRTTETGGRREARTRATRARFLEAGRRLFAEHGLAGVTSHAIAEAAGYAAGTFYLHFKDKHALFDELAESAAQALEDRLLAVMVEKTEIPDIAYAQADAMVSFAAEQRELLLIAFHRGGESSDVGARILERLAAGVSSRRREFYADSGGIPAFDPDVLAQAIVGMWAQVLVWWAEDPSRATREDVIRTMTHFQLFGSRRDTLDLDDEASATDPEANVPHHPPHGDASS